MIGEANHSRTVVSVPRPPGRSKGIHSPLLRGGDGGGAVYLVAGGRGAETPVLLFYHLWLYYIITFGYTLLSPLFYFIIATGSVVMAKFMWVCFEGL